MALYMVGISNQSVPVAWPLIMGDHKAQSTQTTTSPQQTIFKRLGSIENTRRNMVIYPFTIRYSEKMWFDYQTFEFLIMIEVSLHDGW
jgi:hypothetical protein